MTVPYARHPLASIAYRTTVLVSVSRPASTAHGKTALILETRLRNVMDRIRLRDGPVPQDGIVIETKRNVFRRQVTAWM